MVGIREFGVRTISSVLARSCCIASSPESEKGQWPMH